MAVDSDTGYDYEGVGTQFSDEDAANLDAVEKRLRHIAQTRPEAFRGFQKIQDAIDAMPGSSSLAADYRKMIDKADPNNRSGQ